MTAAGSTPTPEGVHDSCRSQPACAGTLYVVATPLGNLRDVSLRALDILGSVDIIGAEDTRVTGVLLRHYGIATHPVSIREHNERARADEVVAWLSAGKSVALVTDAGTPAISDPGARLVDHVRAAGLPIVPIPGANAALTALSVAGQVAEPWVFMGFLPTAAGARRALLAGYAALPCALVCYEAPHRVRATIADLVAACGGARELIVGRELTKRFESIDRMRLADADAWFAADSNRTRGEFVLIVDRGPDRPLAQASTAEHLPLLRALLTELPPARAARVATAVTGCPRDQLYALAVALREGRPDPEG
jgi:16S rRNA (cytidine1402-2'-O)-methyltransferase